MYISRTKVWQIGNRWRTERVESNYSNKGKMLKVLPPTESDGTFQLSFDIIRIRNDKQCISTDEGRDFNFFRI